MQEILEALEARRLDVDRRGWSARSTCRTGRIEQALKLLELDGAVARDGGRYTRTAEPWAQDEERIERCIAARRAELAADAGVHATTTAACMEFLDRLLDDPGAAPCGQMRERRRARPCRATVDRELVRRRGHVPAARPPDDRAAAQWAADAVPRLSGQDRPAERDRHGAVRLRRRGLGARVQRGKDVDGPFDRELVVGRRAKAIRDRWRPEPAPEWVTAVPSVAPAGPRRRRSRARSRASSACRTSTCLAADAGAEPQEAMQNSAQQLANAHARRWRSTVRRPCRPGPVLLVDDLVDSRWTLTVAGWLLREGGSGPVHPFALAASSGRE